METRKFIWYFFWTLVFGGLSIAAITKADDFWSYAGWIFLCALTGLSAANAMDTFKTKTK